MHGSRFRIWAAAGLLSVPFLTAQEFRATLTGRVTDSSDAAVPSVPIRARNTNTNDVTSALTDAQGNYTILFLKPGTYDIAVEAPGFKKFTREGLTLNVGQAATVNVTLEVGAVSEQITVSGEAPLLDSAKADRGAVLDHQRILEFPLNVRNPIMLSTLAPGVTFLGVQSIQNPWSQGSIEQWSINGSQNRSTEFLLDGAPNNARAGENHIAYIPPVDAVQEFKIQTNAYDAQYGHTGGGIVNVSLKGGTNRFHGTAYEFARRSAWDANAFQNNAQGAPKAGNYLDQYGFEAEGPIWFPKLYNGRDKSFFMMACERVRAGRPRPLTLSVPEPEMLSGDFSKLVDGQGRPIVIFDPATGRDDRGVWVREPLPGNRISPNHIDPIAQKILGFMPKPNIRTPGQDYSQLNFFRSGGEHVSKVQFYNLALKFDQNIGDKHRMFFRHASNDYTEFTSENGLLGERGESGLWPVKKVNDAYVLDWVGTIGPSFIANARFSYNRYKNGGHAEPSSNFDLTSFGFPQSLARQIPGGACMGRYSFAGYISIGGYPTFNYTNNFAIHPNITKVQGSHTIKSGADLRWIQYALQDPGLPFSLSSTRGFTQRQYNRGDALSGNSIASFLLGSPSGGGVDYNVFPFYVYRYYAPWVQDDWKATRRLTLNLGLRWDFNIAAYERRDRLNRSFDAGVVNPADKLVDRAKFPGLPALRGGLLFAGVNGVPRAAADLDKNNLQPRFGFAYLVTRKLVMRGGWARYCVNPNNDYFQNNGFSQSTPLINSIDGGRTALPNLLANPFPDGLVLPPGSSLGLLTFLGRGFSFVNPQFEIPYVNQFSFGFQYELPWSSKLEVSYVGSRSHQLETSKDFNYYDLSFRQKCNLMEGGNPLFCDDRVPNPFFNLEPFRGTGLFTSPTVGRATLALPYPHFGSLTERTRNDGKMWYNSLQITLETRSKGGLNLLAAYTLSKQIEQTGFLDVQRNIMQRGPVAFDHPHRLTIAAVYQLPFGKGKRLLGGWEATTMFQWQSGFPWSLPGAIYVKDARVAGVDWSAPRVRAVNPCVAKWNDDGSITMQPFSVQYGCKDYNFLIPPRYAPGFSPFRDGRVRLHSVPQADASLNKTTRITERTSVQFRAEAFNLTNTYWFYNQQFNNNTESATFGTLDKAAVSTSNSSAPRQVQFAVKFIW